MALEIERKFRVVGDDWRRLAVSRRRIRQAYLSMGGRTSIRVRIDTSTATLTIKTARPGAERREYEYAIPIAEAEELLLQREGEIITKVRYVVAVGELLWEIDVFDGENAGLVIAEVELADADQPIEPQPWLGEEVTHDRRYYNADLARHPFARWAGHTAR